MDSPGACVVEVKSLGVCVVIVESVGDEFGVAVVPGAMLVSGVVLGGTGVVVGLGIVCGAPGVGVVVCAKAAVESVATARPVKSAIRMNWVLSVR